ncbi:hypothetical protein A2154_03230 [Candidatus Gottesmanbacteria bacterium RBG_16_43_7]|uniref:50S ribosomal protein L29 n=1 Tax=Candidatus Gottesmanbacteria bacterium RBG_16_43_7 TaxID=1798373 RepID=A0A1F5ZAA0_9BACT|nr:MAG: hypothetical protein A2154_03230 [Candidatus Gottesmanbacteria bacterium RBG_16_43_7]
MKLKDKNQLHQSEIQELRQSAAEIRRKISEHEVNMLTKPQKNLRSGKLLRQNLAVVLTIIRAKELNYGRKS